MNAAIAPISAIADIFTNHDPSTAGWNDLASTWFFEQGKDTKTLNFGPNAKTTRDIVKTDAAAQARALATISACSGAVGGMGAGNFSFQSKYGKPAFFKGLGSADMQSSFLGTFTIEVNVAQSGGKYKANYLARNKSGWESGTRLRRPAVAGSGENQGILPDKKTGDYIHLGGNMLEYWTLPSGTINCPQGR